MPIIPVEQVYKGGIDMSRPIVAKSLAMEEYDLNTMLTHFNVHRLPDIYNGPESYMAFVFFTRPDLNIFEKNGNPKAPWTDFESYSHHLLGGDNIKITRALTDVSPSEFLPFLTQRAKGFSVGSRSLKTIEKGNTYQGINVTYGLHNADHRKGKTFNIEYVNDRYLSVWKLHSAWRDYIDIISFRNKAAPKREYIYPYPTLDYAVSAYYFVTKRDASTLVYWQKFLGVFPIEVPDDIFSSQSGPIFEQSLSIQYACSIISELNSLSVLEDFAGLTAGKSRIPVKKFAVGRKGLRVNPVLSAIPFISTNDKRNEFYLLWG